jgi:hypothetical protein
VQILTSEIFKLMEILGNDQLIQVIFELHHNYLLPVSNLLAQSVKDPDVLGQIQDAWFNFIDSGQVWALVIGTFFGYTFKGFTG